MGRSPDPPAMLPQAPGVAAAMCPEVSEVSHVQLVGQGQDTVSAQ